MNTHSSLNITVDSVAIEILTVERSDETLPVGEVNVKVLQEQPDGQTEVIAEGTTNLNGIAKLQVPSGALLEISGAKDDYVDVIKTRRIRSNGGINNLSGFFAFFYLLF